MKTASRHPLAVSGALLVALFVLRAWLQWIGPLPFDHFAADHYGPRAIPEGLVRLFAGTEFLVFVLVTMVLGTLLCWVLAGRNAALGFILSAAVVVWSELLKRALGPVPFWARGHSGVDFPSGHMSWATAVFGYMGCIAARRRHPWLAGVCVALIILVAVERVLSGAHTVSDLIGGFLLAVAWIVLTLRYVYRPIPVV